MIRALEQLDNGADWPGWPRTYAAVHGLQERGHHVTPDLRTTSAGAAELLGISPGTLRNWRSEGKGPASKHIGQVWYWIPEVLDWIDAQGAPAR